MDHVFWLPQAQEEFPKMIGSKSVLQSHGPGQCQFPYYLGSSSLVDVSLVGDRSGLNTVVIPYGKYREHELTASVHEAAHEHFDPRTKEFKRIQNHGKMYNSQCLAI